MTVGYFSPLPPVRSGVADYSGVLMPALPGKVLPGTDGEVNLYHMGNNGIHAGIYRRALERPGVVVLHDTVLHHFHLGQLSRHAYIEEFVYCYGGWFRGLAERLFDERTRSVCDARYFQWPMVRRLAERSRAVVVHNAGAAAMIRREAPSARVVVIPHLPLPGPPVDAVELERWRGGHGLAPSHTLFGLMGYLRESKRVLPVLRVFTRLRAIRSDISLLVAGQMNPELARSTAPLLDRPGMIVDPHLPEAGFQLRVAACDVGINLRYPGGGESSGMTARWLQLGRPVIVSDTAENRELPLAGCPRVATGVSEEEELAAIMLWLAESPIRRAACGRAAREWAAAQMSLPAIAERYWRVLSECRDADSGTAACPDSSG